ncbi:MAG: DoxX family membrane protein [Bacteroidia bacterium]|nr:DoxX family membrane protein [Bacteroidia bacterium]MDW8088310.1 DoxX family membrane protein [Bacteroidia bacterium]
MRAKRDIFLNFSRLFVGFLFIFSGLIKVNDVYGFSYKLEEYFEVFSKHTGWPFHEIFGPWSLGLAGFIAVAETGLALFLLLGYLRHFTAWSLLLMIVFFTFLTAYSAITKAVSDCGCFGDAIKLTPWQSFAKDVVLLGLIGYIFLKREELEAWLPQPWQIMSAWGGVGLIAGLTIYFYLYLPAIDFLPYKVGKNLRQALTPGPTGTPELTDYLPLAQSECAVDELSGKALVLVAKDLSRLEEAEINAWRRLLKDLPKSIKVVGITASPSSVRNTWPQAKGIPVCFAAQDQTVLKAILRASAGALYLEDGVIRAKWGWRQLPEGRAFPF